MTNWRAVVTGFIVAFVLGLLGVAVPVFGQAGAGLVGGFVAGYLGSRSLLGGAWHGLLAGALGALVFAVLVLLAGSVLAGLTGSIEAVLGTAGIVTLVLAVGGLLALPSAVGGAIGGVLR